MNSRALLGALPAQTDQRPAGAQLARTAGRRESELRQVRGGVIKPCPPGQNLATQRPCLAAETAAEVAVGTPLATSPPPPPRARPVRRPGPPTGHLHLHRLRALAPRGEIGRGPRACQANPKRTEPTPPRSGTLQQPGSPPAPGRTGGEALNSTLPGSKKRFAICNFGESMAWTPCPPPLLH